MKGLAPADIPDLVATTLPHFKNRGKFEAAFEFQQYYFLQEIFQQDKYQVQDGSSIEWTLVLDDNGTARHTKLFSTAKARDHRDVVKLGKETWKFADAEAIYEAHMLSMNRGSSAKAKYIKTQYFAAYKGLANLIEKRAVLTPQDQSDDESPNGVMWWASMTSAGVIDYEGSFGGRVARYADGTTTSLIGGLDTATNPLWRSWCANHEGTVNLRTTETMRRTLIFTEFRPPTTIKEMFEGPASKRRILWSLSFQAQYESLVNRGSDNRNGDLSPFKDMISFRGIRCVGLPTLENVSYKPIYVVDFSYFQPIVHGEWWMKEDEVMRDVDQRHVFIQGIDCQYNYICTNRRMGVACINEPIPA